MARSHAMMRFVPAFRRSTNNSSTAVPTESLDHRHSHPLLLRSLRKPHPINPSRNTMALGQIHGMPSRA